MEAIIFIGVQAAGKSTFYKQYFADTHIRINLDMIKTRHREGRLLECCLDIRQRFVIDNTNPTRQDRQRYIPRIKSYGFRLHGYYFAAPLKAALARNAGRREKAIPEKGVLRVYRHLQVPRYEEGFDRLFYVRVEDGGFNVMEWR